MRKFKNKKTTYRYYSKPFYFFEQLLLTHIANITEIG